MRKLTKMIGRGGPIILNVVTRQRGRETETSSNRTPSTPLPRDIGNPPGGVDRAGGAEIAALVEAAGEPLGGEALVPGHDLAGVAVAGGRLTGGGAVDATGEV